MIGQPRWPMQTVQPETKPTDTPTMKQHLNSRQKGTAIVLACLMPAFAPASSHMDAPLITLDPAANTADVYAFRSSAGGNQYLTAAVTVYPFEEPGIGPNKYNFDDNVL